MNFATDENGIQASMLHAVADLPPGIVAPGDGRGGALTCRMPSTVPGNASTSQAVR